MKKEVCTRCINEWAAARNLPQWRWNHTVFDDSFWEDNIVLCPANDHRPNQHNFKEDGVPKDCTHRAEQEGASDAPNASQT
jgi:hypothetical protein